MSRAGALLPLLATALLPLSAVVGGCSSPTEPACGDPRVLTFEVRKFGGDYSTNRLALMRQLPDADCRLLHIKERWLVIGNVAWLESVETWRCRWCGDGLPQRERDGAF